MCFRTRLTSGMTSWPSTRMGVLERLRRAMWRTARFSVMLIFSPANIFFGPAGDVAGDGEGAEEAERFAGDAVLGEVEEEAFGFEGEFLKAVGVLGEGGRASGRLFGLRNVSGGFARRGEEVSALIPV